MHLSSLNFSTATHKAFAPGHVTGFFQTHTSPHELAARGSRGAGICLSLGATAEVTCYSAGGFEPIITVNGEPNQSQVIIETVKRLLELKTVAQSAHSSLGIRIIIETQLPIGQGFGMSGAGALSTSLALNNALSPVLPRDLVVQAAHEAEVMTLGGLGDVVAQSLGGLVVREAPGAPPIGKATVIPLDEYPTVVLAVIDEPVSTASILTDSAIAQRIDSAGAECIQKFMEKANLGSFFKLSYQFTEKVGLGNRKIKSALDSITSTGIGLASMAMLGNSVFAIGDTDALANALGAHGTVLRCSLARDGAKFRE